MTKSIIYKNNNDNDKKRLDIFLANELNISRSKINTMIKDKLISVNDKFVKSGYILFNDDEIKIIENDDKKNNEILKAINHDLDIRYEDEYLMIVNKPNDLLVHPTSFNEEETLASYIKHYFISKNIKFNNDDYRWGICHRLDKNTTGLILIAKNYEIQEQLQKDIKENKIKREYIGIIKNKLPSKKIKIDVPIIRSKKDRLYMETSNSFDAKNAITYMEVIDEYDNFSIIKYRLETGRTHQIRVHAKYIKCPILNDPLYGNEKIFSNYHQYLHAYKIGFTHPITKKYVEFATELPNEFSEYISKNK